MEKCLLAIIMGWVTANFSPVIQAPYYILIILLILSVLLINKAKITGSFTVGFIICAIFTNNYLSWQVKAQDIAKDVQVTAFVTAQMVKSNQNQTLTLQTISLNDQALNAKLRVNTYKLEEKLNVGDKIEATLRLKPINGLHNQYGFNYVKWLVSHKIQAIGYVKAITVIDHGLDWRENEYVKIKQSLHSFTSQALLYALLTGDKEAISQDQWLVLKNTGTVHLMVISGLHLSLIFAWTFTLSLLVIKAYSLLILNFKSANINAWALCVFKQGEIYLFSSLVALVATFFFAWFSGFAIPTVRALIMLSVFVVGYLFFKPVSWSLRFYLAMFCVLIYDPFASLSVGFWLSFGAVAAIMFSLVITKRKLLHFKGWALYWRQFLGIQLALGVLLIPIQWWVLGQFSILSLIVNPLAIPWMSFTVIPLALLGLLLSFIEPTLSYILYSAADYFFELLWGMLIYASSLSSAISVQFSPLFIGCAFLSIGLILLPINKYFKFFGGVIFSLLLIPIEDDRWWRVQLFDVGQGLAVLIERENHAVLYDTGAAYASGFNMIDAVVLPYIQAKGLTLDAVIISHSDNDHAGGLQKIKDEFPFTELVTPQNNRCIYPAKFIWLALDWQVLAPNQNSIDQHLTQRLSDNNSSCVMKVSQEGMSLLLTGDIERKAEFELATRFNDDTLTSTFALVPHHGSKTSTTDAFVNLVNAEHWLLSRGLYNRFGHPHSDVVKRLSGYPVWDTAYNGQTTFTLFEEKIAIETQLGRLFNPWWLKN